MDNVENSTLSPEVKSLKADIHALEVQLQSMRIRQDWWNEGYLVLGLTTIVLATLLGGSSLFFQRKASNIELSSRPVAEDLGRKNLRLREILDQVAELEVSRAQTTAFEAATRAGDADERASKAQASLASAEQLAAEASAKAEQFRLAIANANKATAAEHLKSLYLERALAWRRLDPTAAALVTHRMAKFKGLWAGMWVWSGDAEAHAFAIDIASALYAAKIVVTGPGSGVSVADAGRMFTPELASERLGVLVSSGDDAGPTEAAKELSKCLNDLGYTSRWEHDVNRHNFFVQVATRPMGAQGISSIQSPNKE